MQQGKPKGLVELASFEKWSRVLGGILEAADIGGFLMSMPDYKEHGLEARTHDTGLVEALIRTFGFERFTAMEAIERLMMNPDTSGAPDPAGLQPGGRDGESSVANQKRFACYMNDAISGRVHAVTDLKAITKMLLPGDHPAVCRRDADAKLQVRVVRRQPVKKSPIQMAVRFVGG